MQRRALILATIVTLLPLLAPTLSCAMPSTERTTATEHDCCEHAKQPCKDARMAACCTIAVNDTTIGMPVVEKKMSAQSTNPVVYGAVEAPSARPPISPDRLRFRFQSHTAPPIPIAESIQILRI